MKINKRKRIGNVIIFVEGEKTEFEILENIFHHYLGYSIKKIKRRAKEIIELQGYDRYSKITLINTPTNNINSILNIDDFFDYIFKDFAINLNLDTINNPVYFIFDRDPGNNRPCIVEKLLNKLTNSQNDTDEQNGLLLLSFPSIESFILSLHEKYSYNNKIRLGKDLKKIIDDKEYEKKINDNLLKNSINEFIDFLLKNNILDVETDIYNELDKIGLKIYNIQKELYFKEKLFYCISQLVEILIDLQIVEL